MKMPKRPATGSGRSHAQNNHTPISSGELADLIPVISGQIGRHQTNVVSARALHAELNIGKDFSTWITNRISEYGFVIGSDYAVHKMISPKMGKNPNDAACSHISRTGRPGKDYLLTLNTAKEIAMVERNDRGRAIRCYFIRCEEELAHVAPQSIQKIRHQLKSRIMAASYHSPMCAALALQRAAAGKPTYPHNYATEANMITRLVLDGMTARQWAAANGLTGDPREHMSSEQLELIAYLEQSNTTLIDTGMDYHKRKTHLARLIPQWRMRQQRNASHA
ncbi:antA/AntB antirepressor family protein [Escherichia coli]|nr:antA/AntB antirepressor family protein [Escherichia coli]EFC1584777.1 antA/AntB antirepressor family protein [Escherichia coli]EFE9639475.1 antA/AntB antirepressor family protein [Escherichia coli]EFM6400139.1 antA/AntB antirepressor family protein [Escherichia coli]EGJ4517202.1 antA/AntB antirepressor family protein [Escherichia coli]